MGAQQPDSAFGQTMQSLRTAISLSRAGLANKLGVSRQAVEAWEAGRSYPEAEHLKAVISLGVKTQAFEAGHETEEIRVLWKAACQKVPLDEGWLASLLGGVRPRHLHLVPKEGSEKSGPTDIFFAPQTRVDWGDALAVPVFYGREEELGLLSQWIVQEHARVVTVLGMGGIGKSALSVNAMHQWAQHFEVVVWRSLRDAPSCEALLDDCLQVLSPKILRAVPASLEQRIGELVEHLRKTRVLLVLDNLECLLAPLDPRGHFSPGFLGYGQLLQRVAERDHQSCLLLTSREQPADLRELSSRYPQIHSLHLTGLDVSACSHLLEEKGLIGTQADETCLIEAYSGNPLALRIVAETVLDLFGGELSPFLAGDTIVFGSVTDLLDEQFARLSAQEKTVLCWLAIMREPVTLEELQASQVNPLPRVQLLEAIDAGYRRSLIERRKRSGSFTLQSMVLEYVTAHLVASASREIQLRHLDRLIQYGFSQATAREDVRQTQERLLLCPLLAELQRRDLGHINGGTRDSSLSVEEQLLSLLDGLRGREDSVQGYGPANLVALLRLWRGNLSGLDLSKLSIRSAYLQGVEMQDTSLAEALIHNTILTEAINATWTVAIAPDGRFWAAGSQQGQVRLWEEGSRTLHRIWRAHANIVYSLAFSPDGRLLASGSHDCTVKLWDVEACSHGASPRDALLWTSWQGGVHSLAFTPDGRLLASGGRDGMVRLWEMGSQGTSPRGTALQTLAHGSPVYAVAFSPDGRLLASGGYDGQLRLWERQETVGTGQASVRAYVEIRSIQTGWVRDLAFDPSGQILASAHMDPSDRAVKLWEVENGQLLYTLPELQGRCIAWSPNGRVLAGHSGKTIWLWNVEQGRYQTVLHGHEASVYSLTFSPGSHQLLSSSADGTLCVWHVESGKMVRVIAGYGVIITSLAWSPDCTYLATGGNDTRVSIWDVSGETPPRVLRGHSWVVAGVSWSPDGRHLASSGWDRTIRLWDATSGGCVQIFEGQAVLQDMAWSPDGSRLACGTFQGGVQVWDVRAGRLCYALQPYQVTFTNIAWSPDGTRLAGSADDGCVYLWESADGTGQGQADRGKPQSLRVATRLPGHHSLVFGAVWSPDGTRLASGSGGEGGGELFVWDVKTPGARTGQIQARSFARDQTGESPYPVQTFAGHSGQVYAVVWSRRRDGAGPRGDWLISGDTDGMLYWWDVERAVCVRVREAHQGTIRALKVSPDGKRLASCGDDGAVLIWDVESGEQRLSLRRDRPYERLNITGIRGLGAAQIASLRALGAIECDSFQ